MSCDARRRSRPEDVQNRAEKVPLGNRPRAFCRDQRRDPGRNTNESRWYVTVRRQLSFGNMIAVFDEDR